MTLSAQSNVLWASSRTATGTKGCDSAGLSVAHDDWARGCATVESPSSCMPSNFAACKDRYPQATTGRSAPLAVRAESSASPHIAAHHRRSRSTSRASEGSGVLHTIYNWMQTPYLSGDFMCRQSVFKIAAWGAAGMTALSNISARQA